MQQFSSFSDYSKTIFKYFKKSVFTNNFQDKTNIERFISQGNLSFFEIENSLFILRSKDDFYIINYYINLQVENSTKHLETKIKNYFETNISNKLVIEEVKKSNILTLPEDFFINIGFEKKLDRIRLTRKNTSSIPTDNSMYCNSNIVFEYDATKILQFLYDNFDKYYGCIQDIENIKDSINNKNLYLYTENNLLLGILDIRPNSKISEIRHLAIDKNSRGKGIGNILLEAYLQNDQCNTKIVWTGKGNASAIGLYKKYGYTEDEYYSTVYMK